MTSLLDVNVLLAVAWPSHVHHRVALDWFRRSAAEGWATCPITQAGFVRVSSSSAFVRYPVTPSEALAELRQLCAVGRHEFWAADISFLNSADIPTVLLVGAKQVTDAYLLGLAVLRDARLATLDRSIAQLFPAGSARHERLLVIS